MSKLSIYYDINPTKDCQDNLLYADVHEMDDYFTNEATFQECLGYNEFIRLHAKYPNIFPSEKRIAEVAGVTDRQVRRWLVKWEERGFIKKKQRWNNTNIYWLPTLFNNQFLYKNLKHLFYILRKLPLSLLTLTPQQVYSLNTMYGQPNFQRNVRLSQVRNNYIHTKSLTKASVTLPTTDTDFIKKESKKMELKPPSQAIQQLTCFKLTKAGMVTLSAFTDEVITAAAEKMKGMKGLREPFRYFYKLCKDISSSLNQQPNYSAANRMMSAMGLDPFGQMIEPGSFISQSAGSFKALPITSAVRPHGPGKCAELSCQALLCLNGTHPARTREWAKQEREKFLSQRDDLVQIYGEEKASKLIGMVSGLIPVIVPKEPLAKSPIFNMLQSKQAQQDQAVPFLGDDSNWEEV